MARRKLKLNPADTKSIIRDIDETVQGSGSAIDLVYQEYKEEDREIAGLEALADNLKANDQPVPRELKVRIRSGRARIRELDRRIHQYARVSIKRIQDRLTIVKSSPGASFNRAEISRLERALFKLEQKSKKPGIDVRADVNRLMGSLLTLEQGSSIILRKPGKKVSAESRRKSDEAQLYASVADEWKRVYKHAKKDIRLKDDIDWVRAQLRSLDLKFKRGESIRRGMERVSRKIRDIHNRTKPRARLKTYTDARNGLRDFGDVIIVYSKGDVTREGVDHLKSELTKFESSFSAKAKAEWGKTDQRKFAADVRKLRKVLDKMAPKGRRRKNPCVGFHFHGKDADEIMRALEGSAERQQKKVRKSNPAKRKSTTHWRSLVSRCQKLWEAYCNKPSKKRLNDVFSHLEKMKESTSKAVRAERSTCLRVANKEAKRLGIK